MPVWQMKTESTRFAGLAPSPNKLHRPAQIIFVTAT